MCHKTFFFHLLPLFLTYLPVYAQPDKQQGFKHILKTLFMNTLLILLTLTALTNVLLVEPWKIPNIL